MDLDLSSLPMAAPIDFTEHTTVTLDLDPVKLAKQLEIETGEDWTSEHAATALAKLGADHGGFVPWLREQILDHLASEHSPGHKR